MTNASQAQSKLEICLDTNKYHQIGNMSETLTNIIIGQIGNMSETLTNIIISSSHFSNSYFQHHNILAL